MRGRKLLGVAVLFAAARPVLAEKFSLLDLGPVSADYSDSSITIGLNNAGQVAGAQAGSPYSAFLTQPNSPINPATDYFGGNSGGNLPIAVNDAGQVCGGSSPYIYSAGTYTFIPVAGAGNAYAINASGQVAGSFRATGSPFAAFFYDGTVHNIPGFGFHTEALGINDAGYVVGYSKSPSFQDLAFLYNGKTTVSLGVLPGDQISIAKDINNSNVIVGQSASTSGVSHGYEYFNGYMRQLGGIGNTGIAEAINDRGQIVGSAAGIAFLCDGQSTLRLQSLVDGTGKGWVLSDAKAINNRGQIVAIGGTSHGLIPHAVLLTPYAVTTFPIAANGYNKNVIVAASAANNPTTHYAAAVTSNFDELNHLAFYESGLQQFSTGLPFAQTQFASDADPSTQFRLQPVNANNVVLLDAASPSGTLSLVNPARYSKLAILTACADGGGIGTLTLHFSDGTTSQMLSYNAEDWGDHTNNEALTGIDPVYTTGGTIFGLQGTLALHQATLNLTGTGYDQRPIDSITFYRAVMADSTFSPDTGIFGLSGQEVPEPASVAVWWTSSLLLLMRRRSISISHAHRFRP